MACDGSEEKKEGGASTDHELTIQILDVDSEEQDGAATNEQNAKKTKCATIKTSTRQVSYPYLIIVDQGDS